MARRHLLVESADYWFQAARDTSSSMPERLLYMENALNHTENTLIAALEDSTNKQVLKLRTVLAERRKTKSGTT